MIHAKVGNCFKYNYLLYYVQREELKLSPGFNELEDKRKHKKELREMRKKGNEEIAVGIAATIGFAAAYFFTKMWFLLFPLIFVGLIPLSVGLSKLFKKKIIPEQQKEQGNNVDKEKEILKVARDLHGRLTVLQLASQTSLSIEDARTALDAMVKKGYVQLNVLETGVLQYEIPEFFSEPEKDDVTKQIDKLGK